MATTTNSTGFEFLNRTNSEHDVLRGIVLLGRNVASYKFALAGAIIELAAAGKTSATLEELASPFSRRICEHLENAPKQTTSRGSRFLAACARFNDGTLSEEELLATTVKLGFANVIDAFHVVGRGEVGVRFFHDLRRSETPGISFTDEIFGIAGGNKTQALDEIEARWRLVETAWDLGINTSLIRFDEEAGVFTDKDRRVSVTSARDALNGYQKGQCFYCYRTISTESGNEDLADVDHFFPHVLQRKGIAGNLDGVWNLVLSCRECNRGQRGKFDSLPDLRYVSRLLARNNFLCESHNPLRETLMLQTGSTPTARQRHMTDTWNAVSGMMGATWSTQAVAPAAF